MGTQHTLAEIRRKFWIPKGRQTVQKTLKRLYLGCKKLCNKPYAAPPIPPLPASRVIPDEPFANTGIDVLGPFYIDGNKAKKTMDFNIDIFGH